MDKKEIIAGLQELIEKQERELQALRSGLERLTEEDDSPKPGNTHKPRHESKPRRGGEGNPFKPKYDEPARLIAGREFAEVFPKGLTLRQLQDRLSAKGCTYTDQAMMIMLNKQVRDGVLKKAKAPSESPAKFQFILVKGSEQQD